MPELPETQMEKPGAHERSRFFHLRSRLRIVLVLLFLLLLFVLRLRVRLGATFWLGLLP